MQFPICITVIVAGLHLLEFKHKDRLDDFWYSNFFPLKTLLHHLILWRKSWQQFLQLKHRVTNMNAVILN